MTVESPSIQSISVTGHKIGWLRSFDCKNFNVSLLRSGEVLVFAKNNEKIVALWKVEASGLLFKMFTYLRCRPTLVKEFEEVLDIHQSFTGTCTSLTLEVFESIDAVRVVIFGNDEDKGKVITNTFVITPQLEYSSGGAVFSTKLERES
jgi:hypothetical protein